MRILRCPNPDCVHAKSPSVRFFVKKGYFITKWNAQRVARYRCRSCGKHFSSHTLRSSWRQKKPFQNEWVFRLYSSAMTQRRMAMVLGINRKTVVRKFLYLAELAELAHRRQLESGAFCAAQVQFDEMESFEHTRLKPLSIALAVDGKTAQFLGVRLAQRTAKGRLAVISRKKYGYRADTRPQARANLLAQLPKMTAPGFEIVTDHHPAYPRVIRTILPQAQHVPVKTRGETRFLHQRTRRRNEKDALFQLNFVCAKIRHDLSRMARKVWVTTKKAERLKAHLDLYIAFHNGYQIT